MGDIYPPALRGLSYPENLAFFLSFWASFTTHVRQDSFVHPEIRGPDEPSLAQAILCWAPQNSWLNHATMLDIFSITCIVSSLDGGLGKWARWNALSGVGEESK